MFGQIGQSEPALPGVLPARQGMNPFEEAERVKRENAAKREHNRVADLKAQGMNPDGSPIKQDYQSLLDPVTGKLKEGYQLNEQKLDMNSLEGLQAIKKQALRDGMSPWALLQLQKQKAEEAGARDEAAQQGMSSLAQARSSMASRGGLGAGSSERLAASGGRDLLMARQKQAQQGNLNRLGIGTQDEQMRQDSLGKFATGETDISKYNNLLTNKANEFNVNTRIKDKEGQDSWTMNTYGEQMKKWAANRQAEATEKSGGGGGGGK